MTVQELLDLRDRLVNRFHPNEGDFRTGFQPFYDYAPTIRDPKKHWGAVSQPLSIQQTRSPAMAGELIFFAPINTTAQLLITGGFIAAATV